MAPTQWLLAVSWLPPQWTVAGLEGVLGLGSPLFLPLVTLSSVSLSLSVRLSTSPGLASSL